MKLPSAMAAVTGAHVIGFLFVLTLAGILVDYPLLALLGVILHVVGIIVSLISIEIFAHRRWMVMLVAWATRSMPVELIDFECKTRLTMAKLRNDKLHAYIYWHVKVGEVFLLPTGVVDADSPSSYVYFWLPLNRKDRTEMLLRYDFPDFSEFKDLPPEERRRRLWDVRKSYTDA
jgi:hypothetical protein